MKLRMLLLALLLAAFALRVYRIDDQSLWTDEGYAVDFAGQGAQRMLQMWSLWQPGVTSVVVSGVPDNELAAATDTHAPLHYFVLHYWMRVAGQSEFSVRFPSLIFGLLVVPLLYALGRRLFDRRAGMYAAALGAASPFYVAYSQEARMYTMSLFFSVLSVYLMVRILQPRRSTAHLAGYVLATALGLYTHYFSALVVIFENVFVLSSLAIAVAAIRTGRGAAGLPVAELAPKRTLALWLLSQASVLLLLLPWAGVILKQVRFPRNEALPVPPVLEVLSWYWQSLNAAIKAAPQSAEPYLAVLAALAALLIIARWITDRPSRPSLVLLVLFLFIPLAVISIVLQRQPMFHPRYLIAASPAYYLLLAAAMGGLGRLRPPLPHIACAAVVSLFALGLSSYYFDPSYAKDDARGVAEFLARDASADDLVVLDYPEPIGHYYAGKAPYVFLPGDRALALDALNKLAAGRRNIYHVHWWQSRTDPSGYLSYLLSREGKQVARSQYRGFRIDKYALRQGLAGFADDRDVREVDVTFDGVLKLKAVGYGAVFAGDDLGENARTVRQGGKLWVVLRWQLLKPATEEYKAFVHLQTGRDRTVGQSDRYLLKGQLRTDRWAVGDTRETYHIVSLVPGTPPGAYDLRAGLYQAKTQRRLNVIDRSLARLGASTPLGAVEVARFPEALASSPSGTATDLGIARLLNATLDPLGLLGYSLSSAALTNGDTLNLTLLWRANRDVQEDYTFHLEAVSATGPSQTHRLRLRSALSYPTNKWINGQLIRDWRDFQIPPQLPAGQYLLKGRLTKLPEGPTVGIVDLGEVDVRSRAYSSSIPSGINRLSARFGDSVEIVGYDLKPERSKPGDTVSLTLYWQALKEMDRSFTVFTHLLDSTNKVIAQHDGIPAEGSMPTTKWREGEVVADEHELTVNGEASPGQYVLEVGFYDANDGKRLPAESQSVQTMGDAALIGNVTVEK